MSFQYRPLQELIEDIRYRYSIGGVRNRHPPERIKQLWNVSWQQLRSIVSLIGDGTFLTPTAILTLPTTPIITGEVYAEIPWPVNAVAIYGVQVRTVANGHWYPLKRIPWAAHHDYQFASLVDSFRRQPGPVAYCSRNMPDALPAGAGLPATVETAGQLMILPVPTSGSYRLWYEQAWQPRVQENDLFPGHEEWFEYAIYNTCIKMLSPDGDVKGKQYAAWAAERGQARELMEARAQKMMAGDAVEPRDARGDGWENNGFGGQL